MDPVIELATVTVSYLWLWRELFPDTVRLSSDDPPAAEQITTHPEVGMAVYARMRDLTLRSVEERVIAARGDDPAAHSLDTPGIAELVRTLAAERGTADTADGDRGLERVRRKLDSVFNQRANREDVRSALTGIADRYVSDLNAILAAVGPIDLRGAPDGDANGTASERVRRDPISRERLTALIAQVTLQDRRGATLARALNYRPLLLRDVDADLAMLDEDAYPRQLAMRCRRQGVPVPFALVFHEELDEIQRSRELRGGGPSTFDRRSLAADRATGLGLLGVAFSGGGIRSATFNLGVLQGLASAGWLPRVDYLSTVSGGGYIGAWLLAWIKRRGSIQAVQQSLRGAVARCDPPYDAFDNTDPSADHVRPIRFLREYSNYLTPRGGFFSADTWTMMAIWVRNTALNLLVLALFLMGLLVAPRVLGLVFINLHSPGFSAAAAALLMLWAGALAGWNLGTFDRHPPAADASTPARGDSALLIAVTLVVPLFVSAFLVTAALWAAPGLADPRQSWWSNPAFLAAFAVSTLAILSTAVIANLTAAAGDLAASYHTLSERLTIALRGSLRSAITGAVASFLGALLLLLFCRTIVPLVLEDTQRGVWIAVAFGPLAILVLSSAVIVMYLGLEGAAFQDERREWWSRVGAWISLIGGGWALISSISFFAPLWLARLGLYARVAGAGWLSVTGAGAWLASGGKSNGKNLALDRILWTRWLITLAPFIFILGFLSILSVVTHLLLAEVQIQASRISPPRWPSGFGEPVFTVFPLPELELRRFVETYWAILEPRSFVPLLLAMLCLVIAFLLARRVDVNEFSMHHFYRNRLVRAYLGASRSPRHRSPNAFTGLDLDDDLKLWRFQTRDLSTDNDASSDCQRGFNGPYPIINATLNASSGEDLAWQERQGQSFVFTPLYSGFDFAVKDTAFAQRTRNQFAYQRSELFGSARGAATFGGRDLEGGMGIGTAIAISGAAANPNAGYHTSPGVAFLLTVFNVRLGWWIGNPRMDRWRHNSPRQGLFYLMSELFGYAGTQREYVNLSDGGHFDNMGLYELVRRRCKYVVVCDAEEDGGYTFEGIANAIRKCRVDFGVVITLQTNGIRPETTGGSMVHAAVGTISYPGVEECGRLIYIKASVTGDEPIDVLEYKARFPVFPHESTADQSFDESQFESYRALGLHIAGLTMPPWPAGATGFTGSENARAFDQAAGNIARSRGEVTHG
jgi:hypothetical protein